MHHNFKFICYEVKTISAVRRGSETGGQHDASWDAFCIAVINMK